jgi:hypothetical protein
MWKLVRVGKKKPAVLERSSCREEALGFSLNLPDSNTAA